MEKVNPPPPPAESSHTALPAPSLVRTRPSVLASAFTSDAMTVLWVESVPNPRFVRASVAVEAPVPPSATARSVTPVIVPPVIHTSDPLSRANQFVPSHKIESFTVKGYAAGSILASLSKLPATDMIYWSPSREPTGRLAASVASMLPFTLTAPTAPPRSMNTTTPLYDLRGNIG